jgi:hypothetical protein
MRSESDIRAAWLAQLFSTEPADRPRAEDGVRRLYKAAGFAEPRHFVWYESPFEASWPVALLAAPHNFTWAQSMESAAKSRDGKERIERARSTFAARLGAAGWDQAAAMVGVPIGENLAYPPNPATMFKMKFFEQRFDLDENVALSFATDVIETDLFRAEQTFWGGNLGALRSAIHCPTTDRLIGQSFFDEYPFFQMAFDEHLVGEREPPALMSAAWDVARSAGLWWPFQNVAILSDRPSEIHLNEQRLLQNGDGPAAVYRDGWRVYAWNGKAVPERWIMDPASVPPRDFKGFDPTFQKFVKSKIGTSAPTAKKAAKPGSILKVVLPAEPAARLEKLRAHAGDALPLYERYVAGDHRNVWTELIALGADVRSDPHAADALAVAYETMRRVDANVRTVVERLTAMGYIFSANATGTTMPSPLVGLVNMMTKTIGLMAGQAQKPAQAAPSVGTSRAHVPPAPGVWKEITDFEKRVGAMPLSLRAFYEVVGEVNLIGRHPTLDPKNNSVATDPLVVYGFDEGAVEYDEEDEDGPAAITIAPDDLHKADTSGGDPYEMAIPDPRADGELLNERHGLFFVDYLRLCFRFGGFPGYEGQTSVPAELATLSADLMDF